MHILSSYTNHRRCRVTLGNLEKRQCYCWQCSISNLLDSNFNSSIQLREPDTTFAFHRMDDTKSGHRRRWTLIFKDGGRSGHGSSQLGHDIFILFDDGDVADGDWRRFWALVNLGGSGSESTCSSELPLVVYEEKNNRFRRARGSTRILDPWGRLDSDDPARSLSSSGNNGTRIRWPSRWAGIDIRFFDMDCSPSSDNSMPPFPEHNTGRCFLGGTSNCWANEKLVRGVVLQWLLWLLSPLYWIWVALSVPRTNWPVCDFLHFVGVTNKLLHEPSSVDTPIDAKDWDKLVPLLRGCILTLCCIGIWNKDSCWSFLCLLEGVGNCYSTWSYFPLEGVDETLNWDAEEH